MTKVNLNTTENIVNTITKNVNRVKRNGGTRNDTVSHFGIGTAADREEVIHFGEIEVGNAHP